MNRKRKKTGRGERRREWDNKARKYEEIKKDGRTRNGEKTVMRNKEKKEEKRENENE